MNYIVMFSGGIASWAAAKRAVAKHGAQAVTLLFCDTLIEDEDLYRCLDAAADNVGAPLVKIAEGRTPWQVFYDERMLGNSRIDPCSKILKRELARKWLKANAPGATVVVGIDWTEPHRLEAIVGRYGAMGHPVEAPLMDSPLLTRTDLFRWWTDMGLTLPRLYQWSFSHNNCGGFCVKAGQGHFARLLKALPERYAYHEHHEQEFRAWIGKDVSILTDTTDGAKRPLTLRVLRERIEAGHQPDLFDIGGCGCFVDEPESVLQAQDTAS